MRSQLLKVSALAMASLLFAPLSVGQEGEAEAEAARLLNAAHGKDVKFYVFWRSMQSYRESIVTDDKSLILTTDNDFLKSLQSPSLLQ